MTNKSFHVKYMVVRFCNSYDILDTSIDSSFVAQRMTEEIAHRICKFLNESEGYTYENA